jgi:8-oxo-dGTP pyrophosphatase MutT (NUDIX family)
VLLGFKGTDSMRMNRPILAASALILHTGRILLVRSKTTQEEWGFPGGKQEKEETPQQAVSREVKEELGIDIQVGKELGSFISHNRKFEIKCFVAETRSFDLRVNRDEIIEVKWSTLREPSLESDIDYPRGFRKVHCTTS